MIHIILFCHISLLILRCYFFKEKDVGDGFLCLVIYLYIGISIKKYKCRDINSVFDSTYFEK